MARIRKTIEKEVLINEDVIEHHNQPIKVYSREAAGAER